MPPPACLQDPPDSRWHLWRDVPRPRIRRRLDEEDKEDKEDKRAKKEQKGKEGKEDKKDKNDSAIMEVTGASFSG